jgi:hypothetical protein
MNFSAAATRCCGYFGRDDLNLATGKRLEYCYDKSSQAEQMRPRAFILQIVELFVRYICAILVTFSVAALISLIAVTILGYDLMALLSGVVLVGLPSATIAYCAAFAAIYSGSLCLARNSRRLGCVVLMILGIMCYQILWYTDWQYEIGFAKHGKGSLAPLIALGGLSACILTLWISRRRLKGKPVIHSPIAEKV